jgi:hypothetical protein
MFQSLVHILIQLLYHVLSAHCVAITDFLFEQHPFFKFLICSFLVPPFISSGASRQTAWEASISERRNYGREMAGQILPNKYDLQVIVGFFNLPQSCNRGQMALLPLLRKACWGFFLPEKSNGFSWVWTRNLGFQRPACSPLDHWSRFLICWYCCTPRGLLKELTGHTTCLTQLVSLLWFLFPLWCHVANVILHLRSKMASANPAVSRQGTAGKRKSATLMILQEPVSPVTEQRLWLHATMDCSLSMM